jgi:hypothetical protein
MSFAAQMGRGLCVGVQLGGEAGQEGVDLTFWVVVADLPFRPSQHHVGDVHAKHNGVHRLFEVCPETVGDSGIDTSVAANSLRTGEPTATSSSFPKKLRSPPWNVSARCSSLPQDPGADARCSGDRVGEEEAGAESEQGWRGFHGAGGWHTDALIRSMGRR